MNITSLRSRRHRRGFTLVEVLVAAALSMLIMVMVTTAFQKGMDTLSQLKAVGEMQQRLRNFEVTMRGDLLSDHFDSRYGGKVSDQRLDLLATGITNDNAPWRPPTRGFFRVMTPSVVWEGTDTSPAGGNPSTRATDHILHMTVRRNATRGDKLFSASMPTAANATALNQASLTQMNPTPQTISSEWAEVAYFLDTANPVGQTPGGVQIYGLYRRVRVLSGNVAPGSVSIFPSSSTTSISTMAASDRELCQGVSHAPDVVNSARVINTPEDIRDPRRRLGGILGDRKSGGVMTNQWDYLSAERKATALPDGTFPLTGNDLLLTDVISFEIKADWDLPAGTTTIPTPATSNAQSYEFPFNILPVATRNSLLNNQRVFDTWFDKPDDSWLPAATAGPDRVPQTIRIRALQIKVRVWDRKHKMARQITIIQDI